MIAQVIVDVAAKQTDRLFEYLVPELLEDSVKIGSRVFVPFGKSRRVQGFVIGLVNSTEYEGTLKELLMVVDELPPLTEELVELSDWLSSYIFSYRISILKTMLPSVMRANYHKILVPNQKDEQEVHALFGVRTEIDLADIDETDTETIATINHLLRSEKVNIEYLVESRAKVKEISLIDTSLSVDQLKAELAQVRKNATQQIALLEFLIAQKSESGLAASLPLPKAELESLTGVSSATIKKATENGIITQTKTEVYRRPVTEPSQKDKTPITLLPEQEEALAKITASVTDEQPTTFLLEGVTGSGKTEVYLHAIASTLSQGKTALMLVPEISLTPQMVRQVEARFGDEVAVLHSGLSEGEKYDEWRRIRRDEAKVVVGARSAVFAPLKNLGLIIIDEEHENSYKQDDTPRYHARDVALWRSKYNHAPLVLGSATPSLESRARAQKNVYQLLTLSKRANQRALPAVKILDMKDTQFAGDQFDLTQELVDAVKERVQKHEQTILLLNRRGFSSFMLCRSCGFVLKCPNCDISLTYHKAGNQMKCHYCGHSEVVPTVCPNCHSNEIRFYGTGTQKIEEELNELIPTAKILRMDVDTTRQKGSYEKILNSFGRLEADILLGTQMIAKGLDFPTVTLVGVINADTALSFPDFRSAEKTFQLLTQVSGRAGRAELSGEVLIQTYNPEHYAIALAKSQDYERFYQREMQVRHQGNYPPYFFTALISVSSKNEQNAAKEAFIIKRKLLHELNGRVLILGPTPSAVSKIKQHYFYQILVKYKREPELNAFLHEIQDSAQTQKKYGLTIYIDLEPDKFM